ncbi:MAG TPA: AAA family ATPase [Methylomirabilota bacterium]|jgi:general secretion pathway protein A
MYVSYFGLKEAPFSITPDPRYLYMSERHREALAHLLYGIGEGGGFVQLTGEVGTGKTTLCRCLLEQVPPHVNVALILNPRLTALELLAAVCDELRIPYPSDTTSTKTLVDVLYRYLLDAHGRGRRTVLIIDEAQDLSIDVLEQVRLLTNLETTREKLLQIILIGQPELIDLLARDELRQLAQRVTARYHLQPFSELEARGYVRHRLKVAGQTRAIFTDAALRRLHVHTSGVPRLINVVADRALLGAYSSERSRVDADTVRRAAREVRGVSPRRRLAALWPWGAVAGVAVVAALAAVALAAPRDGGARLARAVAVLMGSPGAPVTASIASDSRPPAAESAPASAMTAPDGAPVTVSKLDELLANPAVASDRAAAFRSLVARWGLSGAGKWEAACERVRPEGLRCLSRTGTWTRLRRYDLPAVLELVGPAGDRHYATLVGMSDDTATLEFGERRATFPLTEIERFWDGPFVLLWRAPAPVTVALAPGMRSKDIEWVRRRLSDDGAPATAGDSELYDAALQARVVAFQRRRALTPDGIIGEETLAQLSVAAREPGVPSLSARN